MTPFRQIVADQLGVPLDDIRVIFNDTARVATGVGTFGSRSAAVGGSAVLGASERVRAKVIRIAADALEAAPSDVEIEQGRIGVKGVPDRSTTLGDIAARAYSGKVPEGDEPGLEANRFFKPEGETFPTSCPPPMSTIRGMRATISGCTLMASAIFVSGPTGTSTVSGPSGPM